MLSFLKHWLLPHEKNNHRAKILHNSSLLFIVILVFSFSIISHVVKITHPDVLGISYSISANDLLSLVNQQRQSGGLPALVENAQLDDAARRKAADMLAKNYWAHFAPDGSTSPWGFIKASGYNYQFAGENLAKGFTDSGSVVTAWMNSPTHRDNILSNKFKDVGFAIVPGTLQGEDTVLVVEMFGEIPSGAAQVPEVAVKSAQSAPAAPQEAQVKSVVASSPKSVERVVKTPKIDTNATKTVTTVGLIFMGLALCLDALVVERRKIPRIVGHNLDHLMLIVFFIVFLIIMRGGVIV